MKKFFNILIMVSVLLSLAACSNAVFYTEEEPTEVAVTFRAGQVPPGSTLRINIYEDDVLVVSSPEKTIDGNLKFLFKGIPIGNTVEVEAEIFINGVLQEKTPRQSILIDKKSNTAKIYL